MLEVQRDPSEASRGGKMRGSEEVALCLLSGGVVDFEDVQIRARVAEGEGIQAGSE